jgi:hypothetical protein
MYLKFSACGKFFFSHTFDNFELHIVKTILSTPAFGKVLLYFELPIHGSKTWDSHRIKITAFLEVVLCSSACSTIAKEQTALVFKVREKVSLLHCRQGCTTLWNAATNLPHYILSTLHHLVLFFFVLFCLCIFILVCFVSTSVRTTATKWQLNCS